MKYVLCIVDPNQEYNMQDITNRATETAKTVLDTVPPEVIASIDDSKFMSNIGKATLVGGTALGAGLYALNGAKNKL